MSQKVRIVFRGEIIAGEAEAVVKQRAAQLFKASPEQLERIFSGIPVVLRKDLPEEEGPRYQRHLEKAGMRVYVEQMKTKAAPPPPPPPSRPSPVGTPFPSIVDTAVESAPELGFGSVSALPPSQMPQAAAAQPSTPARSSVYSTKASLLFPAASEPPGTSVAPQELSLEDVAPPEEITCPKCGAKQPRRTLCLGCGLDIPRFLKAQEEEKSLLQVPGGALAALHSAGEHVEGKDFRIIEEDTGAPPAGKRSSLKSSPYRAPAANLAASFEESSETAGLMDYLSLAPSGHIKRLTYLTGHLFSYAVVFVVLGIFWRRIARSVANNSLEASMAMNQMDVGVGLWLFGLIVTIYGIRLAIHRCRDIGWSPWLVFLFLLPVANLVLGLCLLFWPSGEYKAPSGSFKVLLVAIGCCFLSAIWAGYGAVKITSEIAYKIGQEQKEGTRSNR